MKRQLEISTFLSFPEPKRLKISIDVKPTKFTFDDEDETSPHSCHPIIASASGRLYNKKTKKEIAQHKTRAGYMIVNVPKPFGEKGYDPILAHRAIWESFNGEIPANMESDHINDERTDNRLCNLQLLTKQDNCKKAARRPGWIPPKHHPVVPVVATCLDECYQEEFHSMYQAAKVLGVHQNCITHILAGRQVTTKAKDGTRYTFHRA